MSEPMYVSCRVRYDFQQIGPMAEAWKTDIVMGWLTDDRRVLDDDGGLLGQLDGIAVVLRERPVPEAVTLAAATNRT